MTAILAVWTFLKSPAGRALAGILAIAAVLFVVYSIGHENGRADILNGLKDQRITILKDGVVIDNNAIGADDDALCDLLGGCS